MNARCSVEGVEDTPLVSGRGCLADDMGERPGTAHAAVLRAPHVHAEIVSVDATAAVGPSISNMDYIPPT